MGFFWLGVFLIAGLPVALGIELYTRALRRNEEPLSTDELLPLAQDAGVARRMLRRAGTAE